MSNIFKKVGKAISKGVKKVGKVVGKVANSHLDLVTGGRFSKLTKASSYFDGYQDKLLAGSLAAVGGALGASALGGMGSILGFGAGSAEIADTPWYSKLWNAVTGGLLGSGSGNSFLGGLVNTGLGTLGSYLTSQEQLKQQERLQDKAFNQSVEMWNMQNAYNTPKAQMERYAEAGLNPNLIYGNGVSSAGNASSAPSYEAPHYKGMDMQSIMAFQSLQNLEIQNELLNQQLALAKEQTRAAGADADTKVVNASYASAFNEAKLRLDKADAKKTEADADTVSKGDNSSVWTLGFWRKGVSNLINNVADFIKAEQKKSGSKYPAFERYKKKRGL